MKTYKKSSKKCICYVSKIFFVFCLSHEIWIYSYGNRESIQDMTTDPILLTQTFYIIALAIFLSWCYISYSICIFIILSIIYLRITNDISTFLCEIYIHINKHNCTALCKFFYLFNFLFVYQAIYMYICISIYQYICLFYIHIY